MPAASCEPTAWLRGLSVTEWVVAAEHDCDIAADADDPEGEDPDRVADASDEPDIVALSADGERTRGEACRGGVDNGGEECGAAVAGSVSGGVRRAAPEHVVGTGPYGAPLLPTLTGGVGESGRGEGDAEPRGESGCPHKRGRGALQQG